MPPVHRHCTSLVMNLEIYDHDLSGRQTDDSSPAKVLRITVRPDHPFETLSRDCAEPKGCRAVFQASLLTPRHQFGFQIQSHLRGVVMANRTPSNTSHTKQMTMTDARLLCITDELRHSTCGPYLHAGCSIPSPSHGFSALPPSGARPRRTPPL
jgi:hypothetical protein